MSSTEYAITPMHIDDYDQVYELWTKTEGIGLGPSNTRQAVESYLARNPGLSLVARDGQGRLVGAVLCGHDGARGTLRHLAVAQDVRGRGIGRRLVEGCLAGLRAEGITKCTVFVFAGNEDGERFWTGDGWVPRDELKALSKIL